MLGHYIDQCILFNITIVGHYRPLRHNKVAKYALRLYVTHIIMGLEKDLGHYGSLFGPKLSTKIVVVFVYNVGQEIGDFQPKVYP